MTFNLIFIGIKESGNRENIMPDKMLKFVDVGMQMPTKRTSGVRTKDFKEIYDKFIHEKAKEQSSRCSQCGVPFCQVHCPLHNNIPDWLKLTAEGRLKEAQELAHSTNNMPEICGSICPQDRLCEGNCVIERAGHGTVTIGSVEKYITDIAWEKGWIKPVKVLKEIDQSIGIIGAGPAGLACAEELRKSGYKITIYDRYDRPGGLLIYGIPNFKLEKFTVERRTNLLKESGIKFKQNFEVGKNISLDELRKKHDAILIATGVYKPREIDLPGFNLKNIFPAMEFLMASNRKGLGDRVKNFDNGILNAENKNVIVIGGGDTGVSRAGITITSGRLLGFNRFDAAKISFFLSIPALAAASFLGIYNVYKEGSVELNFLAIIAVIFSFIFAYLTIVLFLNYIRKFSLNIFVIYRILLSLFLLSIVYL